MGPSAEWSCDSRSSKGYNTGSRKAGYSFGEIQGWYRLDCVNDLNLFAFNRANNIAKGYYDGFCPRNTIYV